jgi:hypothetical protein
VLRILKPNNTITLKSSPEEPLRDANEAEMVLKLLLRLADTTYLVTWLALPLYLFFTGMPYQLAFSIFGLLVCLIPVSIVTSKIAVYLRLLVFGSHLRIAANRYNHAIRELEKYEKEIIWD